MTLTTPCQPCSNDEEQAEKLKTDYESMDFDEFGTLPDDTSKNAKRKADLCSDLRVVQHYQITPIKSKLEKENQSESKTKLCIEMLKTYEELNKKLNSCDEIKRLSDDISSIKVEVEKLKATNEKLEATNEIRARVDYLRELIAKEISDKKWYKLRKNWPLIYSKAKSLFGYSKEEWDMLSQTFYAEQSTAIHAIHTTPEQAKLLLNKINLNKKIYEYEPLEKPAISVSAIEIPETPRPIKVLLEDVIEKCRKAPIEAN
jgi:hypothetical protein